MRVHLRMLGCRLNQSEIDQMARQFEQQGHEIVADPALADHVVVNTCAVTADAVSSGRKMIREIHRQNEQAQITVTGCHAQIAPNDIAGLPGVANVVSNLDKESLVPRITGESIAPYDLEPYERGVRPGAGARTRAFVKVQDGCDNACTFCVTRVARGAGRSYAADDVIHEINALHSMGYQEAVLTGVHLGSYGHDHGDTHGLMHLMERILTETTIPRVRLSSLEPWDIAPNFFSLWQDARLCPHLHLPLQSGCDSTLKRMRRNTNQAAFSEIVESARAAIPDLRITTDVITGFPGETDEEFAISEAFIHAMDFAGLHVFRYSTRPGTPAARMKGQIANAIKQERSHRLLTHAQEQEQRFAARYIGQALPVLWEQVGGSSEAGFLNGGYTPNYLRVQAVHPRVLTNLITPCVIEGATEGTAHGVPVLQ